MDTENVTLKKTALHAVHCALGAKMVPFAGWEMPVQYQGVNAEHEKVRTAVGVFYHHLSGMTLDIFYGIIAVFFAWQIAYAV